MRKWALIEQALLSLVNFGLALLLARILDKSAWGTYSLGFVLMLFVQGFQRALVSIPITTMATDDPTLARTIVFWCHINVRIIASSVIGLGLGAGLWYLLLPDKWIAESVLIASFLVPGFFMQEFWRRILIQTGKIKSCAVHAFIYFVLIGLLMILLSRFPATPMVWAIGVSASALAAGLLMSKQFSEQPSSPVGQSALSARIVDFGKWAILSHIAYSAYTTGIQLVLSFIAGAPAMGNFSAVRNLVQPINTFIGAIDSVDKPRASKAFAKGGFPAMFASLRKTLLILAMLGGGYLLACAASGGFIINWIYNDRYGTPWKEVWLWCLVALAMLLAQPTESGLYVAQRPDALFQNRVVSAVIGLGTAAVLVPYMEVAGALIALIAGWLISALLATFQLYRYAHHAKLIRSS
jgi:O-antigen/teichoic acid export membrane protein